MTATTLEEIQQVRAEFERKRYPKESVTWGENWTFHYYVLPATIEPRLPHFTLMMATEGYLSQQDPSDEGLLLGISADVDEEFREFVIRHELCRAEHGHDRFEASIQEWGSVIACHFKESAFLEYASMRHETFRQLGAFLRIDGAVQEEIRDCHRTEKFWHVVCGKYRS